MIPLLQYRAKYEITSLPFIKKRLERLQRSTKFIHCNIRNNINELYITVWEIHNSCTSFVFIDAHVVPGCYRNATVSKRRARALVDNYLVTCFRECRDTPFIGMQVGFMRM